MKIKSVVILGGGSSGWMTATALLNKCPELEVTLIENTNIKNIGVGEATIPAVSEFFREYMGFTSEKEWMSFCDATYKVSIRFQKFKNNNKEILYHPFWDADEAAKYSISPYLFKKSYSTDAKLEDFYASNFKAYHMSEQLKFSKKSNDNWHAHHMDANKLAKFCKNKCLSKGLNYIEGNVINVLNKQNGDIQSLELEEGRSISGDIFFDCTGFSAILISKNLKDDFIDITDTLLNDRAIATRIPYINKEKEMEPFTDGIALSAGWVWNIPLWSRIGTGYVYSSKFKSAEDAEKEFKNFLIDKFDKERVENIEFNHINIRAGRHANPWKNNCVSTVLSSGFVEPLESTGLYLTSEQIKLFIDTILDTNYNYNNFTRTNYNNEITNEIDTVVDFINLHYINTNRTDSPYWDYISNNSNISSNLLNLISEVRKYPDTDTLNNYPIFNKISWQAILESFNYFKSTYNFFYKNEENNNIEFKTPSEDLDALNLTLNSKIENLKTKISKMPNHYKYLKDTIYGKDSNS